MASDEKTVMVIDDDRLVLQSISALFMFHGFSVNSFDNATSAMAAYGKAKPAVVLADINMPGMNGLRFLEEIRNFDSDTPVILMTGDADLEMAMEAIRLNAFQFLLKPCEPDLLITAVKKGIAHKLKVKEQHKRYFEMEDTVSVTARNLKQSVKSQKEMTRELISRLTVAAELRDTETGAHNQRIGMYANMLAKELGLPVDYIDAITVASPMHDLGKIVIPDAILFKPGALTAEEFEVLKSHTTVGAEIFSGSSHPQFQLAASIAQTHHERFDGSGYPQGLTGNEIPLEGKIVMLADQYDALRSPRVYKQPFDHNTTCRIILEGDHLTRPEHFDPVILDLFSNCSPLMGSIYDRGVLEGVSV